jgi:excinuclease ABC subunit B
MPSKPKSERPAASDFSIDEFIGEIEKAEDDRLNKRLPQERLRNKRMLDNAARRAAEAEANGSPQMAAEDNLVQKAEGPLPQEKPKALRRDGHEPEGPEVEGQRRRPTAESPRLRGAAGGVRACAVGSGA